MWGSGNSTCRNPVSLRRENPRVTIDQGIQDKIIQVISTDLLILGIRCLAKQTLLFMTYWLVQARHHNASSIVLDANSSAGYEVFEDVAANLSFT